MAQQSDGYSQEEKLFAKTDIGYIYKSLSIDSFKVYYDKKDIPSNLSERLPSSIEKLANPNEEWNASCSRFDELPDYQLVFFALNKQNNIFLIVYKQGGIGVNTAIKMVKTTNKGIVVNNQKIVDLVYYETTFFHGNTIPELVQYIKSHKREFY